MNYKNLMQKLCATLVQFKNVKELFVLRMRNMIPENFTDSSKWYTLPGGSPGSGAGKGGGAGGSIRESGGALGRFGAAQEEGYFFEKQREQLQKLKDKLKKSKSSIEIKQNPDK